MPILFPNIHDIQDCLRFFLKFEEKIRVIPKLEIKNQYLIKGIRFEGLRKLGDPVKFAEEYYNNGADQINIIDIVASLYSRENLYEVVNILSADSVELFVSESIFRVSVKDKDTPYRIIIDKTGNGLRDIMNKKI